SFSSHSDTVSGHSRRRWRRRLRRRRGVGRRLRGGRAPRGTNPCPSVVSAAAPRWRLRRGGGWCRGGRRRGGRRLRGGAAGDPRRRRARPPAPPPSPAPPPTLPDALSPPRRIGPPAQIPAADAAGRALPAAPHRPACPDPRRRRPTSTTSSRSAAPPSPPSSPPPTERPAGDKVLAHIGEHMEAFNKKVGDVKWHIDGERSLLALQGDNVPAPFMTFEAVFPPEILREPVFNKRDDASKSGTLAGRAEKEDSTARSSAMVSEKKKRKNY
ncbi:unnamed protein product, partial [Urochloa humidicola]